MTDTPRTDAVAALMAENRPEYCVDAAIDLARQLERELAEAHVESNKRLDAIIRMENAYNDFSRIDTKLRAKAARQRRELRRLNAQIKYLWCAWREGLSSERVSRLRGAMNMAFGVEAVRAAEHAALDLEQERGTG